MSDNDDTAAVRAYLGKKKQEHQTAYMQDQMLYGIVPQELQEHIISVLSANYNVYDKTTNPII